MTGIPEKPIPLRKRPPGKVDDPHDPMELAQKIYANLRLDCVELEELIDFATRTGSLSAKTLKRLDKSVTVMKVGMKIMKLALKRDKSRAIRESDARENSCE